LTGDGTGVAALSGIEAPMLGAPTHIDQSAAQSAPASSAPTGVIPMAVRAFFRQAYTDMVRSPSLSALAAVALPGVVGLVVLTALGVRVGYRQAKAGIALRTAKVARFAAPRPLTVVRPRALRVVRPAGLGAGRLLEKAA
jgi:hypothetical protein